uniref:Uncharacterized protein n=1 Tax=uncultured bacterium A1Q1_fos_962 TaxID=1256592 RepID=L7VX23_9BACT|nr:hypothetical protein [uncultured bacterium A1Q1_fos_962]
MIRGYFWSIIFMMSMPFLIFGSLGAYFYLQVLKARQAQVASGVVGSTIGAEVSGLFQDAHAMHKADGEEATNVAQRTTKV